MPMACDISVPDEVRSWVRDLKPDVIVNAACVSRVDECEAEATQAKAIAANTRGPGILRTNFDGLLVHFSTAHVFDGVSIRVPYKERCARNPINFYGITKLGGECAAMVRPQTLLVRTMNLFGVGPKSDFVREIRDLLALGMERSLPDDVYRTPTYIPHLAEALAVAIQRRLTGTLHLAGSECLSMLQWARMIAEVFGGDMDLIKAGAGKEGPAPRPRNGCLSTDKARRLRLPLYNTREGLEALRAWENGSTTV